MNSLDPWRLIVTDPSGDVIIPKPYYGHPFYREVPSWINYDNDQSPRQLFDGAFIGGWIEGTGADMSRIGAELTALSAPGYGYPFAPFFRPYGGVFFGAEGAPAAPVGPVNPPPQRSGLLAEVAPIVAPATGGITVKKEIDASQVLRVEICVDGKCYRTSMDLAPAIAMLLEKLNQWHKAQHAPTEPPPSTVVSTIQRAISAATDSMVGVMVGHHVAVMTGSWLSDIGGAIGGTLRKLQPVISTVATGVASAYGGPAAGAAAAKLAPVVTNLQANALDPDADPAQKAQAQEALRRIDQAAAADPSTAQALAAANQAVKNTTVAYHVKDTAQRAAAGDTTAQGNINQMMTAAEQGDPAAKSTFGILAATLAQEMMKSERGAKLWEQVTGRGPGVISGGDWYDVVGGDWYDVVGGDGSRTTVGAFWDDVKNAVLKVTLTKQTNQFIKDNKLEPYVQMASQAVATYYGGPAAGQAAGALTPYVMNLGVEDKQKAAAAQSDVAGVKTAARNRGLGRAADVAHAAIDQTAVAYQLAQILKDARAGVPGAQQALVSLHEAADRGDPKAIKAREAIVAIARAQQQSSTGAPGAAVSGWYDLVGTIVGCGCTHAAGGWYDVVGAAIDDVRERARAHAITKPGTAAGVLVTVDGRLHGRGFRVLDDAIDWLQHITRNPGSFTYAAAYEKDADGNAYIQDEEIGGGSRPASAPMPIPREAPATTGGW